MSTSRPGKVSAFIATLRDNALRELDKPEPSQPGKPTFDMTHGKTNQAEPNQDDNFVSRFKGVHSPHVGNGRVPW